MARRPADLRHRGQRQFSRLSAVAEPRAAVHLLWTRRSAALCRRRQSGALSRRVQAHDACRAASTLPTQRRRVPAIPMATRTPGPTSRTCRAWCSIGDAAGHNDPIIGQGLSITYRDVRIVRDLMLENRDWTPAIFRPYADERSRADAAAAADRCDVVDFVRRVRPARACAPNQSARRTRRATPSPISRQQPSWDRNFYPRRLFSETILDRLRAM